MIIGWHIIHEHSNRFSITSQLFFGLFALTVNIPASTRIFWPGIPAAFANVKLITQCKNSGYLSAPRKRRIRESSEYVSCFVNTIWHRQTAESHQDDARKKPSEYCATYLIFSFVSHHNKQWSLPFLDAIFNQNANTIVDFLQHHFEFCPRVAWTTSCMYVWKWPKSNGRTFMVLTWPLNQGERK